MTDRDEELEYVPCALCGSSKIRLLVKREPSHVVQCRSCGLIYRNPRSRVDIQEMYLPDESYQEAHIDVDASRLSLYERVLNKMNVLTSEKGRVLDVGCGPGFFLRSAQERGWEVYGVDISHEAIYFSKNTLGLTRTFESTLRKMNFQDRYFDVVTFWNALDFFLNPLDELKETKRILKENGLIFVRVPNIHFQLCSYTIYKTLRRLFGRLNILDPFVFQNIGFSPRTLKKMLRWAGFEEILLRNSALSTGDPYSIAKGFGPKTTGTAKKAMFFFAETVFYITAGTCLIGSSIEIYARKS